VTFGREIGPEPAFAMMDHAIAQEVCFFDTAAAYGGGASETTVAKWLKDRGQRERVTLATKVLPPYDSATIDAAVETSLRRLGVATIDVLFLHRWDATAEHELTLRAFDRLVCSGRVQRLGASNFTADQLGRTLALQTQLGLARFRALQNNHNFAVRDIDDALRAICAREKIAIITYSPLGAGFLTGKHQECVQPGSRFDLIPGHQGVYFHDLARQRLARLQATAARSGVPLIQLALAWALHQPQVDTVLVGGRTPAHLDQSFQAKAFADLTLLRELDME